MDRIFGSYITKQMFRQSSPLAELQPFKRDFPWDIHCEIWRIALDTVTDEDVFDHIEDGVIVWRGWTTRDTPLPENHPRLTLPLVSKYWNHHTAPYLYRTIILGPDDHMKNRNWSSPCIVVERLMTKLSKEPNIAALVQRVLILRNTPESIVRMALDYCRFIRVINMEPTSATNKICTAGWKFISPHLEMLAIPVFINNTPFIRKLIESSTTIKRLHLKPFTTDSQSIAFTLSPSIQHLCISRCITPTDIPPIVDMARCPKLSRLFLRCFSGKAPFQYHGKADDQDHNSPRLNSKMLEAFKDHIPITSREAKIIHYAKCDRKATFDRESFMTYVPLYT